MILLKKVSEIAKMREAGRVVAKTQRICSEAIVPGKTTPLELDALAERLIEESGGIASFKGYRGFPNAACISVNDVVVHGIPDGTPLEEGDVVGLDFGVILDGWHADGAWTYPVGKISEDAQRLLNVSQEALNQGIAKARVGNRVEDISAAVQKYVEGNGYAIVRDLVGHGIGRQLHEEPSVPNFGRAGRGAHLREGTTICIEPMVNAGTWRVETDPDKWTMRSADRSLSAHFEHTVAVTREGPEILTLE